MIKKITNFFLLFFIISSILAESISQLPSIDWQKQNLEDRMREKIDGVLKSIIRPDQYTVDIDIQTMEIAKPDFNKRDEDTDGGFLGHFEQEENQVKEGDANGDKSKALVKFNDDYPQEVPEDYILFSKFGIEAPLVDDFNDLSPDGKIVFSMENNAASAKVQELQGKINELTAQNNKLSSIEQIWKYNNSIDIFQNLKSVQILLRISDAATSDTRQAIEKYIKEIKFNIGKIVPKIKFEYVPLRDSLVSEEGSGFFATFFDYLSKFSFLLGILAGVILLGYFGKLLLQKYFELKTMTPSKDSRITLQGDGMDKDEKDSDKGSPSLLGAGGNPIDAVGHLSGVERFKAYIKTSEKDAVLLVKKWIADDVTESQNALRSLVHQMENEELQSLFKFLSPTEKNEWKKLLDQPISSENIGKSNAFISGQIVQKIIVPNMIDDPEAFDMLLRAKPEQLADVIKYDSQIGSYLLNTLSTGLLNQVLDLCENDVRERVLADAVKVTLRDVLGHQQDIKKSLQQYVKIKDPRPFIDKIIELIPLSGPETESNLFRSLGQHATKDVVFDVASKTFPSFLIERLPGPLLKGILTSYPLHDKVRMLLSLDTDTRNFFMGLFAPEGTKANDLMNLEFDNIARFPLELKKIDASKAQLWKHFVEYARLQIKREKAFESDVEDIIRDWIDEFSYSQGPTLAQMAS